MDLLYLFMSSLQSRKVLPQSLLAAQKTGLTPLRHVFSTGSTNDDLIAEAHNGFRYTCVLVADHQTAGKGRLGRRWLDAGQTTGSLLASFRFTSPLDEAVHKVAAVSAAALSVVKSLLAGVASEMPLESGSEREVMLKKETAKVTKNAPPTTGESALVDARVLSPRVLSKWPNDLIIESPTVSGKLAGVLAQTVSGTNPVVVVGIGLNIAAIPEEPSAIGLQQLNIEINRDELLSSILRALPRYLTNPGLSRDTMKSASATIGREVRIEYTDGSVVTGVACDLDGQGRLIVDTPAGLQKVETADVHHLRGSTQTPGLKAARHPNIA